MKKSMAEKPMKREPEMSRFLMVVFLFIWAGIACSCSKAPVLSKLPSDAVVLAFGDSITFGTGAAPAESYPGVLEQLTGRRVVNAGVPGETTEEGRGRLAATFDMHRPALLLLCLGGNDFLRRLDEAGTTENLKAMISCAKDRGIDVVLIGVPRLGFGLETPKLYRQLAEEFAIPLEGKALKKILSQNSLKSDAIHPNSTGYRMLAESIARLLHDSGAL
jgi:lysophospholipase L1-like esterase